MAVSGSHQYPSGDNSVLNKSDNRSRTHKRLKEHLSIRWNRTKHAHFRGSLLFQGTYRAAGWSIEPLCGWFSSVIHHWTLTRVGAFPTPRIHNSLFFFSLLPALSLRLQDCDVILCFWPCLKFLIIVCFGLWECARVCWISISCMPAPWREAGDVWCLPSCLESQGCHLIPLYSFTLSFFCLALLFFLSYLFFSSACWSILLNFFRTILQYSSLRDRLFCMASV